MSAGWVAPSIRGRALVRQLAGTAMARDLGAAASWPEARTRLAATGYGSAMAPEADRVAARVAAAEATIWQLRVLAGWQPVGAGNLARLFAAPIEIANIEAHVAALHGATTARAVSLGSLAVAWPRVHAATSPEQVRSVLAASPWRDPGGADPVALAVGLRVGWARRLIHQVAVAAPWAKGGLAVLLARERFAFERDIPPITCRELDRVLGTGWRPASTIPDLARRLPDGAAWALSGITAPSDLWRAEVAVVHRVQADASRLAMSGRFTKTTVAASMALQLIDLWRINVAIELAGRGPNPMEVFDAVA